MSRMQERMDALTAGHTASAATLAQLGVGGAQGGSAPGRTAARSPVEQPDLKTKPGLS